MHGEYARVSITRDRDASRVACGGQIGQLANSYRVAGVGGPDVERQAGCAGQVASLHPLESPEERQLYPVVLGIGPIRISGTDPVRHQCRSNFLSEIVKHIGIVRGVADIDTLCCSERPATERRIYRTGHFTGVGGVDCSIAASDPCLSLIGEIVRCMHHHRGRANRFELTGLTTHGCEAGIDVGLAEGRSAKAAV